MISNFCLFNFEAKLVVSVRDPYDSEWLCRVIYFDSCKLLLQLYLTTYATTMANPKAQAAKEKVVSRFPASVPLHKRVPLTRETQNTKPAITQTQ